MAFLEQETAVKLSMRIDVNRYLQFNECEEFSYNYVGNS